MSFPVVIRNIDWIKSGKSGGVIKEVFGDRFMDSPHYCGPAENYLHEIISEALEEDKGEFPVSFEWAYDWKDEAPTEWFHVREGADRNDYL